MDLALYGRVLRRHRLVLLVGTALALVLALSSYYRIDGKGILPSLEPRQAEIWQSQANVFLTEPGFPVGRRNIPLVTRQIGGATVTIPRYNDPARYAAVAALYARLATSDEVRRRIAGKGPPFGSLLAFPVVDETGGNRTTLPIISVVGRGGSSAAAKTTVGRGLEAFFSYVAKQQKAAGIAKNQRVRLTVLNAPQPAALIEPRKQTLPIVVFLAVMIAAIVIVFVLENSVRSQLSVEAVREAPVEVVAASPPERHPERQLPERQPEPETETAVGVRRWA